MPFVRCVLVLVLYLCVQVLAVNSLVSSQSELKICFVLTGFGKQDSVVVCVCSGHRFGVFKWPPLSVMKAGCPFPATLFEGATKE